MKLFWTSWKPNKQGPLSQGPRQARQNTVKEHAKSCVNHLTWAPLDPYIHRQHHHQWPKKKAPHFAWAVSVLYTYIRVIRYHPQGTLNFCHISHITTPLSDSGLSIGVLKYLHAPFSPNVKARPPSHWSTMNNHLDSSINTEQIKSIKKKFLLI